MHGTELCDYLLFCSIYIWLESIWIVAKVKWGKKGYTSCGCCELNTAERVIELSTSAHSKNLHLEFAHVLLDQNIYNK